MRNWRDKEEEMQKNGTIKLNPYLKCRRRNHSKVTELKWFKTIERIQPQTQTHKQRKKNGIPQETGGTKKKECRQRNHPTLLYLKCRSSQSKWS